MYQYARNEVIDAQNFLGRDIQIQRLICVPPMAHSEPGKTLRKDWKQWKWKQLCPKLPNGVYFTPNTKLIFHHRLYGNHIQSQLKDTNYVRLGDKNYTFSSKFKMFNLCENFVWLLCPESHSLLRNPQKRTALSSCSIYRCQSKSDCSTQWEVTLQSWRFKIKVVMTQQY